MYKHGNRKIKIKSSLEFLPASASAKENKKTHKQIDNNSNYMSILKYFRVSSIVCVYAEVLYLEKNEMKNVLLDSVSIVPNF